MEDANPYADARTNLRDNVKMMATVLAGTAGAVVAGSPFSGMGALDPSADTLRFALALGGLVVVAVSLFLGWRVLTFTLTPDLTYTDFLRSTYSDERLLQEHPPGEERDELIAIKKEFDLHKKELLPDGINDFEGLEAHVEQLYKQRTADNKEWQDYQRNLDNINHWAGFVRLSRRVRQGLRLMQFLGAMALAALVVFAWAANPKKKEEEKSIAVQVTCASCPRGDPPTPPVRDPVGRSVQFKTNDHRLDATAYIVLNETANLLRKQPGLGVLLLAHTDTVAGERINGPLAGRRAAEVAQSLNLQGGVARTRIFVSEQPKADLPVVTAMETSNEHNRSVEIMFVTLPIPPR
jgi:outer membrane protein OmpA-like peptidoglycan-associated protein